MRLVLASSSPRRRAILSWLGVDFTVVEPAVAELTGGLEPDALVLENARRKASAARARALGGALVLGADTEVFVEGRALGQPPDRTAADATLRQLSGRAHEVLTGICLLGPGDEERAAVSRSRVAFRELDERLLGLYLDSGEWRGRAGAYAIQGLGSILIARVDGDFSNVVGLPIATLLELAPELVAGASRTSSDDPGKP